MAGTRHCRKAVFDQWESRQGRMLCYAEGAGDNIKIGTVQAIFCKLLI